jgi:hypothetical protein
MFCILKPRVYKGFSVPVSEHFPGEQFLPMLLEPLVLLSFLQFMAFLEPPFRCRFRDFPAHLILWNF